MKILLIRHAQSMNNIVQAQVHTKITSGKASEQQAQDEWLSMRQDDPELSPAGKEQLKRLMEHAKKLPKKSGCKRFRVLTSPMRRACETAKVIVGALNLPTAEVRGDLCEVGGIYTAQRSPNGQFNKVTGRAMEAMTIKQQFGFDVSSLPPSGPWDSGRGFEGTTEAIQRAERLSSWLKSAYLHNEMGQDGMLLLVSHADFLALLMAVLTNHSTSGHENNPDIDVSAHGITEATLQGLMAHDAPSVYQKFRISLACTTLLDISPEGKVRVEWMNKKSHLEGKNCTIS
uniref:Phosphoglycerate mutase-like protein n=1 Tax=Guillardia theta TaxID=55529 RepID=A0A7S4KXR3_GUITH